VCVNFLNYNFRNTHMQRRRDWKHSYCSFEYWKALPKHQCLRKQCSVSATATVTSLIALIKASSGLFMGPFFQRQPGSSTRTDVLPHRLLPLISYEKLKSEFL
jgi:hypothetical protein